MVILSRLDFNDISYTMLDSVFWTVIEPSLVIINACIPTMRPIVQAALMTVWRRATSGSHRQLDEYPLTDNHDVLHVPKITAGHAHGLTDETSSPRRSSPQVLVGGDGAHGRNLPTGVVCVKREWEVSA